MRIEIEIPKEFEDDFYQDKFKDALHRLSADAHLLAGRYEQETAIMLIRAFAESKPTFDIEKIIMELKEKQNECLCDATDYNEASYNTYNDAIETVRKGDIERE